jgi:hypothetical protein
MVSTIEIVALFVGVVGIVPIPGYVRDILQENRSLKEDKRHLLRQFENQKRHYQIWLMENYRLPTTSDSHIYETQYLLHRLFDRGSDLKIQACQGYWSVATRTEFSRVIKTIKSYIEDLNSFVKGESTILTTQKVTVNSSASTIVNPEQDTLPIRFYQND